MSRAFHAAIFTLRGCVLVCLALNLVARSAPAQKGSAPNRGTPAALTAERVAGVVTSARDGHGIPHAAVTLSPVMAGTAREPASSIFTGNDGRFFFEALPAGKYHLQATATGYTPAAYQEHGTFSTAIVIGAGYPVDRLEVKLTPSAQIHGHITDSNGDPVQHAQVSLYRERTGTDQERITRIRDVQTDEEGDYEIGNLQAGSFYLAVTATPWYAMHPRPESSNNYQTFRQNIDPALDVAYPTIFYPHALTDKEATSIGLRGGEQAVANFTLQPVHAVSITVQVPPPADPSQPQFPPQFMRRVFDTPQFAGAQMERDDDGWHVTGIAPGEYSLQQQARGGNRLQTAGQPLTVGGAGLTLSMPAPPLSAKVTILPHLLSGAALPSNLRFNLHSVGTPGVISQPVTGNDEKNGVHGKSDRMSDKDEQGEKANRPAAEFTDVPAGDYRLEAYSSATGRPLNIAAFTVNAQPAADRRLHVVTGSDLTVDVSLQAGTHTLDGVATRDGKPAGGAMAVLVPAGSDTNSALFRRDQSDMDGSFTFTNVVPGNYLLIALDDAWQIRWTDLPALTPYLNRAVPVSVAEGGSAKLQVPEAVAIQPK